MKHLLLMNLTVLSLLLFTSGCKESGRISGNDRSKIDSLRNISDSISIKKKLPAGASSTLNSSAGIHAHQDLPKARRTVRTNAAVIRIQKKQLVTQQERRLKFLQDSGYVAKPKTTDDWK